MGYRAPTNVLDLRFDDHPGLQVQAASLPLGTFLRLARLWDRIQGVKDPESVSDEEKAEFVRATDMLLDGFAGALRSWNLTDDDDQPIPATREALDGLDTMFALSILGGWMGAIGGVPAPLSNGSNGGGTFPEVSLPMEPSSPVPPS